jgi:hypothetical protein
LAQLGRELHTGRRRPHDEHASLCELVGVAVLEWRQLLNARRRRLGERWDRRLIAGSASNHHRARLDLALAGRDPVAVLHAPHRGHVRPGANRRAGVRSESPDELGDLGRCHVAVGIVAFIGDARQPALPVRGQQPQGVPALAPPGVRQLAALEHDMVDRPLTEEVAGGKAGMTGADDNGGEALDIAALRRRRP